jgi:hypothetical protein
MAGGQSGPTGGSKEPEVEVTQQEAFDELEARGAQRPEVEEANDQPQVTYMLVEF